MGGEHLRRYELGERQVGKVARGSPGETGVQSHSMVRNTVERIDQPGRRGEAPGRDWRYLLQSASLRWRSPFTRLLLGGPLRVLRRLAGFPPPVLPASGHPEY